MALENTLEALGDSIISELQSINSKLDELIGDERNENVENPHPTSEIIPKALRTRKKHIPEQNSISDQVGEE